MISRRTILAVFLVCAAAGVRAAPPAAADFARGNQFMNPKLSPDGKHVAVVARESTDKGDAWRLLVYRVADKQPASMLKMPFRETLADYEWVSDTRIVLEKGRLTGSLEKPRATGEVLGTDIDGTNQSYLYGPDPGDSLFARAKGYDRGWAFVEGVPQPRNGHVYLRVVPWDNQKRSQLYDLDAASGAKRLIADIDTPQLDFTVRHDGVVGYAAGADEDNRIAVFRSTSRDEWTRLPASDTGKHFEPLVYTADNKELLAYYSESGGPLALVKQNVETGARTVLASDALASTFATQWVGSPRLPLAWTDFSGIPRVAYLDPAKSEAKLHQALATKFPGQYVKLLNIASDNSAVLFSVGSDRDPGSYYLFNAKAKRLEKLFSAQPAIDPARMGERRPIRYAASDGLEITGFLTLPAGAGEKNLPLVLIPHGGPHGIVDDWFFDDDAQFLASRGYAVLQVNYRGSGGRGPTFEHAGYREWGGRIQQDLVDGARWAIKAGHADPARIGIYGASFGGYSALMAPLRAPGVFRCAVGYAGVYDLGLLRRSDNAKSSKGLRSYYDDVLGDDEATLAANSPVNLAEKIAVPVLIVHGEDDKIAPFDHARALRAAMQKHDKPFEWMALPDEGHGFYSEANRTKLYERLAAFLDKHLKAPAG